MTRTQFDDGNARHGVPVSYLQNDNLFGADRPMATMISTELIASVEMTHRKLTNKDYHDLPDLGSSTLKALDREGAEYVAARMANGSGEESRAMIVGSAVHSVMDSTFTHLYEIAPESYKTGDSDKFLALQETTERTLLTCREAAEVTACGESLRRRIGAYLIGRRKWLEPSLFWEQQAGSHGVPCKCRPDMLIDDGAGGVLYLEIKTAAATGNQAWRSACWSYGYWLQQAHYEAGILATGAKAVRTIFAVVRKCPPHDVRFYEFSPTDRDAAHSRWLALVEQYGRRVAEYDWQNDDIRNPTLVNLGLTDGVQLEGFDDD